MVEKKTNYNFQELPIIGKQVEQFDQGIKEAGLATSIRDFLLRRGVECTPNYPSSAVEQSLKTDPVLIIFTHQNTIHLKETLIRFPNIIQAAGIISVLPHKRKDISLIGNVELAGIGTGFQEHYIPIYGVGDQTQKKNALWEKSALSAPRLSPMETGRLNLESLSNACQKLKQGGVVILAPDGAQEEGTDWMTGLGKMLEMLKSDKLVKLVFASVNGWQPVDNMRLFPGMPALLGKKELPVHFSELHFVEDCLAEGRNRKEVTRALQRKYEQFLQKTSSGT